MIAIVYQAAIVIWAMLAAFKWGDWKRIDKYYPTLLFLAVGNLIYEFIAHNKFHLWKLQGNRFIPEMLADIIYLFFIVIPAILTYLSQFPQTTKHKMIYVAKWILIFTLIEWVGWRYFYVINYHHGWNIWWSFLFNIIMFPMLRLHYLSFKKALLLSVPCTFFYLFWFNYI